MDRGAWRVTVPVVARVGQDLVNNSSRLAGIFLEAPTKKACHLSRVDQLK